MGSSSKIDDYSSSRLQERLSCFYLLFFSDALEEEQEEKSSRSFITPVLNSVFS